MFFGFCTIKGYLGRKNYEQKWYYCRARLAVLEWPYNTPTPGQ
jgi:hypothetical protein